MKKFKKIFLRVLPIVLVAVILVGSSVFGANSKIDTAMPGGSGGIGSVENAANRIWATVIVIVQILAFAAIVFAGLRYMFASADTKADIKGQTVILVAGAALVFAAQPIVTFVSKVIGEIF